MIYYKNKIQQDVGATAVEYGILSALIAVVTILGLQATGTNLGTTYCTIANQLSQAVGAGATASGCSATSSSSSSSSSSADSSGSSADSSSSSSSSDSSSSGSDSSSSSSTQGEYNSSNSYSVSDPSQEIGNLNALMTKYPQTNIASMTGIYDSNGNPITTPQQYAEAIGLSDDTFQALSHVLTGTNSSSEYSFQTELAEVTASGKSVYIPSLSDVTFTSSDGHGYSYDHDMTTNTSTIRNQLWRLTGNSSGSTIIQQLNSPTGD